MKNLLILVVMMIFFSACGNKKPLELPEKNIASESK